VEDSTTDDMLWTLLLFLPRICRHRKNRRHRNARNTQYIHVKDRFLQKMFADVNVLLFPAPVSEGADEAG
jgi:hypothetical protein